LLVGLRIVGHASTQSKLASLLVCAPVASVSGHERDDVSILNGLLNVCLCCATHPSDNGRARKLARDGKDGGDEKRHDDTLEDLLTHFSPFMAPDGALLNRSLRKLSREWLVAAAPQPSCWGRLSSSGIIQKGWRM